MSIGLSNRSAFMNIAWVVASKASFCIVVLRVVESPPQSSKPLLFSLLANLRPISFVYPVVKRVQRSCPCCSGSWESFGSRQANLPYSLASGSGTVIARVVVGIYDPFLDFTTILWISAIQNGAKRFQRSPEEPWSCSFIFSVASVVAR